MSISSILPEFNLAQLRAEPTEDGLEPGLLPVFRMVAGLQMILSFIAVVTLMLAIEQVLIFPTLFWLSWTAALFIFVSWPILGNRFGKAFLPIALGFQVMTSLMDRIFVVREWATGDLAGELTTFNERSLEQILDGTGWRLFFFLLIPLVFVAWQYDFRQIVRFTVAVTIASIATTLVALNFEFSEWPTIIPPAIGRGIILIGIGYIITRMMNAQRKQRQALADANAKLVDYATTVEQLAISHERNRLARELHDTLAHTLSSLSVQLEAVDSAWDDTPEQARTLLIKSIANARSGLAETRRALQALRASPLEDLGLVLAIRTLAQSIANRKVSTQAPGAGRFLEARDRTPPAQRITHHLHGSRRSLHAEIRG
ncbi:MAG: histidine kinase, partial [Chloroflexota bacterium]